MRHEKLEMMQKCKHFTLSQHIILKQSLPFFCLGDYVALMKEKISEKENKFLLLKVNYCSYQDNLKHGIVCFLNYHTSMYYLYHYYQICLYT